MMRRFPVKETLNIGNYLIHFTYFLVLCLCCHLLCHDTAIASDNTPLSPCISSVTLLSPSNITLLSPSPMLHHCHHLQCYICTLLSPSRMLYECTCQYLWCRTTVTIFEVTTLSPFLMLHQCHHISDVRPLSLYLSLISHMWYSTNSNIWYWHSGPTAAQH